MATIHDIARLSGFSIATVSRVLNGRQDVRPQTSQRVLEAARAMNYLPHAGARNLRRRQTGSRELNFAVGLLFLGPTVFNDQPFFSNLAAAVERSLRQRGVAMSIITASPEGDVPRELQAGDIDGVISWGAVPLVREIGRQLPTVTVDIYNPELEVYGVTPDYRGGVRKAVRCLLEAGHKRIALLTGALQGAAGHTFSSLVHEGCVQAHAETGIPAWPGLHPARAITAADAYGVARSLLSGPDGPDALLASDGAMLGVLRAAYELGLRVPRDISLIGIDGIAEGEFYAPPLTTIDTHIDMLGAAAVRALLDEIESGKKRMGMELIPATLRRRASARLLEAQ